MKSLSKMLVIVVVLSVLLVSQAVFAQEDVINIGVLQLVEHASLDDAYRGFVDVLKDAGYEDGKNIKIDYQNAQADQSNLVTMSERFVKDKVDLILAIATPAAQAVAAATTDIPILITAVTDPVMARLAESMEKPGTNVSGTTDAGPIDKQLGLLKELFPEVKTLGILFNSSEVNSEVQAKQAEEIALELGWEVRFGTITSVNDIEQVANSMAGKVDAFYAPTDNTIASAMPNLAKVAEEKKIPVICGAPEMISAGGLATIGLDYYKLGRQTGEMAVRVLKGEAVPEEMPIESLTDTDLIVNLDFAKAIGYTFPQEILDKATKIIGE
ncbi:MAG: ABC transporter substrate-binding protein [Chloroflexi bacterium]|nr:ABC transporter substrate-binding protein [Chloroflexota bacterium]